MKRQIHTEDKVFTAIEKATHAALLRLNRLRRVVTLWRWKAEAKKHNAALKAYRGF